MPNLQDPGRYLKGPFSNLENRWTFEAKGEDGLRRRLLHRLRVQEPDAGDADGHDVRRGVPAFCRGVREARGCGLRQTGRDRLSVAVTPASARRRFTAVRRGGGRRAGAGGRRRRGAALPACGPRASSISMRSASTTERARTVVRPIAPKRYSRWRMRPSRAATAKCTRPTGLPGVAPPGPAMPVIDTARSTPARSSAPTAIAVAVSLLTAPKVASVVGFDAEHRALGFVGIGDEAAVDHVGGAGDIGQRAGDEAAGAGFRRGNRQPRIRQRSSSERERARASLPLMSVAPAFSRAGGWWRSRSPRYLPRGR